ncbi:hypothetical protein SEA_THYATIRA_70 [Mycobacterium phage Thyatira]|uniref:Uncharacterized protein n=2 Tax=Kratiovirus TaxID=2948788 RepID=A0A345M997_9CAUD|nr:hypothetical protein PBI_OKIROE_68 [Mycobacterium phage OkiRoe]YP_009282312.1 hypothetical protein SEA_GENGAR_67 [Mycobacterium phage Gengar]YP_009951059.1 hypothetical protein I5G76_gp31 [Mycobacterium phage Thyatira]AOQ28926.1 hypothetical protein SEA_WATERFOUL_69 [Mycobacterium phage Waterfoul]AHZ95629.1 hypothetical protein PBI_OKIROE_68 [Mycobacterium phage OkiRoe]AON96722.1 hypothetical protein SEA_GENGAR_67 [Mycobacterium phage Gengar]AXH67068.1 hypothetical protein SEA_THYATIRA_70 
MQICELFTRADFETKPCKHCGDPIVECDDRMMHFVAAGNGARTAWEECRTFVRGTYRPVGDQIALFGNVHA